MVGNNVNLPSGLEMSSTASALLDPNVECLFTTKMNRLERFEFRASYDAPSQSLTHVQRTDGHSGNDPLRLGRAMSIVA
jgi:hypothetical protein